MSKDKKPNYSLADLAQMLGIDLALAASLGRPALYSQILEGYGLNHVTKCDDCQDSGRYTGDDQADLSGLLGES